MACPWDKCTNECIYILVGVACKNISLQLFKLFHALQDFR